MGKWHALVKWGVLLVLLLLGSCWAIASLSAQTAVPDTPIVSGATPAETEPLLPSQVTCSNVTITNVTTFTATVIWETDIPADSTVEWRGAHCIFDEFVSTDEYIQAIDYAPSEHKDRDPAITLSELRAKITKDLEDMRACNFNTVVLYPFLNAQLDSHVLGEIERLRLKVVFRLEEYKIPECSASPFNWESADADCIIDRYRNASGSSDHMDYFTYFQDHPNVLLFYLINLPLDDPSIPTPTRSQLRQYVAYFYQRAKTLDPNHAVYANTHYGADDKLPQAPVADLVDGVTLTVYATRESWAPYDCGTIPTFTDPDYKIVCKDQHDYFIDKAFTENRLAALGKLLVLDQAGFAYEYVNPGQTNGRVSDKATKFKAIHILARLLKEKPQLAGWGYFKWLDKLTEANWGLLDERNVYDPTPVITHTVVLTDLNPGTAYSLTVGSDSCISSSHLFTTTVLSSTENHPRITITAPPYGHATAEGDYVIGWVGVDPDSNANVSLFYDEDDRGTDGITITSDLSEDNAASVFTWTVPSTLTGAAFVYARIDDGENPPEYDYSSGMLVPSLEQLPVALARGPITIDGAVSETIWSDATPLTYAVHPPANEDTSATVRALWDDEFLYLAFDVSDTQVETATLDWNDDSVSISINNGTFRCRQDVGGTGGGGCKRALRLKPGTTLTIPGDIDPGFTVEMRVPWTQTRVIPNAGDIVPVDFLSVDHDGNSGGAWDDPATIFSKISWDGDSSVDTTGRSLLLPCTLFLPLVQKNYPPTPILTTVSATDYPFQSTGISVTAGDQLEFAASGTWYCGLGWTGPDGNPDIKEPNSPVPSAGLCALVGMIGDVPTPTVNCCFLVGSVNQITATQSGMLYLGTNDHLGPCDGLNPGSCYNDNRRDVSAWITVWRR
jgi:hypothetical protein